MASGPRFQQGMSWLELSVSALSLGIFGLFLAQRLADYQELAERADMEYGVTMIKSALRIRLGVLMVEGRMQEVSRLICENPVKWLDKVPPNYFGEAQGAGVRRVPAAHWYFDPRECSMGYIISHGSYFAPDSAGMKRVRYRVRTYAGDVANNPVGLSFEPMEHYEWKQP